MVDILHRVGATVSPAEVYAALVGFAPISAELRSDLADRVHYGQPPTQAEEAQLKLRQKELKA